MNFGFVRLNKLIRKIHGIYNTYQVRSQKGKSVSLLGFGLPVWFIVFNTTFNNISIISWRSVLMVEEAEILGENHRPVASH
jgi:hypothetical protein